MAHLRAKQNLNGHNQVAQLKPKWVAQLRPFYLVYGTDDEKAQGKIKDSELLSMFTKAQTLDEEDRKCVKSLIKAYLFQRDMQKQLAV